MRCPAEWLRLRADELPPFVPGGRDLFDGRPEHALPLAQLQERFRRMSSATNGDAQPNELTPG